MGAKGRPFYRLVAIDSRRAREGRFVEQLGYYDPVAKPAVVQVDEDKVFQWLRRGAIPSETVGTLFSQIGIQEKWNLLRQGKDAASVEVRATITERKKRTRKVKAAVKTSDAGGETQA